MAKKKSKARRAARKAKVIIRRGSPRGGRMMTMFKTVAAISAVAVVGGAALNMVNSARTKPATGMAAGAVAFGGGALLAFLLGMFKGTRQYVTPVLAGAAAVGGLAALNGPIQRGSASIANALLGRTATGGAAQAALGGQSGASTTSYGPGYVPLRTQGQGFTGASTAGGGAPRGAAPASAPRESKGQSLIKLGSSLADAAASIAGAVGGGSRVGAAAGMDDFDISGAGDELDGGGWDDLDGSEGMDDFAIAGAAMLED